MALKKTGCLILALGMLAWVLAGCSKKEDLLAEVGPDKITNTDLVIALANLPENYKILAGSYKGKRQILDNLVKKSLLVQEAEVRGYQKEAAVKSRIKEYQKKSRAQLEKEMALLQERLAKIDRQVYESVLLTELNTRLKQDTQRQAAIPEADLQNYYDEYSRRLQILNPTAKIPPLAEVAAKIRAILVEEALLKDLEKKNKVSIKEELFRKLYGGAEKGSVTIEDATGSNP